MSDSIDGTACTAGGCAIGPGVSGKAETVMPVSLAIEIVSDVICPWCFVGKRQLERAMARLPEGVTATVRWKPFQLNPHMPPEGVDRVAYRSRKFGSWEHSQRLDAQVGAAAAQVGLHMRHDLMRRTPNTFNAHRLIWLAGREGVQDALVEGLFGAYFTEGKDVGDAEALAGIAGGAGLDESRVAAFLAGEEGRAEVAGEENAARRRGLNGVPTFIVNGEPAFSGALRADLMLGHLVQAAGCPA